MATDKAKVLKIVKTVVNVLVWVFVIFAILVTVVVLSASANKDGSGMASIGGYSPVNVLSDSMKPTFKKGDLIIVRRLTDSERQNLQVGDVISFLVDLDHDGIKEINTHRIIEVRTTGVGNEYVTQGDNKDTNQIADSPVHWTDVLAVWNGSKIGGLGSFVEFLRSKTGFLVCIVLPLIAFFGYEVYNFVRTLLKVKGYGKNNKLDEEAIKRRAIAEYLAQQQAQNAQNGAQPAETAPTEDAATAEVGEQKAQDSAEEAPAEESSEETADTAEDPADKQETN